MTHRAVLSARRLNRAGLQRQLLLDRVPLDAVAAVGRLAGLNAQLVPTAYLSLAARIDGFRPDALVGPLRAGTLARANLMRGTIHLLPTDDYFAWRPALQPALERTYRGFQAHDWRRVDPTAVRAAVQDLLAAGPLTRQELGAALRHLDGGSDRSPAVFLARVTLPLVQIPPAGEWGNGSSPRYAWAEDRFGRALDWSAADAGRTELVRRYLGAFGPAPVRDIQHWSGLTGLAAVCRALGDELVTYGDERGATLYDVADRELPDEGVDAPPRLLPEFDNLLFAYVDRSRVVAPEHRRALNPKAGQFRSPLLVDGLVAGTWRWDRAGDTVHVSPFAPLAARVRRAVVAEAERTASLLSATARVDIA